VTASGREASGEPGGWARLLADTVGVGPGQPERISHLCVARLGVSGAGISIVTPTGNHGVVCATDDVAARVEDLQVTLGEGPCVDAVRTGGQVLIDDLGVLVPGAIGRWPAFAESAAAVGVRAVFAFPLRIGPVGLGALDLYRDRPGDLPAEYVQAALMAADAAAHAVLRLDSGGTEGIEPFTDDCAARSSYLMHVHQATGMVQVQMGVSTGDALLMLRARAFVTGRTLSDIGSDVVARRLRFSAEEP
jgi:hypothetical protein